MITFDQRMQEYCLPLGEISAEGIDRIKSQVLDWYGVHFPDWWKWQNIVGNGNYAGSFVKRFRKYLKKEYNSEFTHAGELGSLVGQYSAGKDCYSFRYSNKLWNEGDFGDAGSCFFGSRSEAPSRIFDAGGGAIQFFDSDGKGYARAWVLPIDNWLTVFNAYGLELLTTVRIIAGSLGLSYRKVRLENNSSIKGLIWINGGSGYVIGTDILDLSEMGDSIIDLGIDCPECCNCEQWGEMIEEDGNLYCESCHSELFGNCDECDNTYLRDDINCITTDDGRELLVCDSCRDDNFVECGCCNRYVRIS